MPISSAKVRRMIVSLGVLWTSVVCSPSMAMSRETRTVLLGGAYGIVGGTALGLVSLPFNGDARTVFMGSSVGFYLGLAAGIYSALQQDEGEGPQGARPVELDQRRLAAIRPRSALETEAVAAAESRKAFGVSVTVLKF